MKKEPIIVKIDGPQRSGKSYLARIIVDTINLINTHAPFDGMRVVVLTSNDGKTYIEEGQSLIRSLEDNRERVDLREHGWEYWWERYIPSIGTYRRYYPLDVSRTRAMTPIHEGQTMYPTAGQNGCDVATESARREDREMREHEVNRNAAHAKDSIGGAMSPSTDRDPRFARGESFGRAVDVSLRERFMNRILKLGALQDQASSQASTAQQEINELTALVNVLPANLEVVSPLAAQALRRLLSGR